MTTRIEKFYLKNYKKLLIIPLLILVLSITLLFIHNSKTGSFINRDISLKGGISATILTDFSDTNEIESHLESQFPESDVQIRSFSSLGSTSGVIIEVSDITEKELKPILQEKISFTEEQYSVQEIGPKFGNTFFKELIYSILIAFVFMGLVVFIAFKKPIPSLAIILSVVIDILGTLAILSLTDIKISTAGIAAFLMVIGYSIDTDIVLTTRLLKEKQDPLFSRIKRAFKTGITMTVTTIAALLVTYFVTSSEVLKQIFLIIIIALFIDLIATWIMNTGILTWYLKNEIDL